MGTMVHGKGTIEIQTNTDVFLEIPHGIQGVIIAAVHTDPSPFLSVIPDNECIIAPIVTLSYRPRSEEYSLEKLIANSEDHFTVHIPHIVQENKDSITVRCQSLIEPTESDKSVHRHVQTLPRRGNNLKISSKGTITTSDNGQSDEILIETQQFCNYISTSTECKCEKEALGLIYGGFEGQAKNYAKMKVYLASSLYQKKAFRGVSILYRTNKRLFFHSVHSQKKIHESYTCMPQIFAAYLCLSHIFVAYSVCPNRMSMPQSFEAKTQMTEQHAANICGRHKYAFF